MAAADLATTSQLDVAVRLETCLTTLELYDATGRRLEVDLHRWEATLSRAVKAGWRPRGTSLRPRDIDIDRVESNASDSWGGRYDVKAGQMVSREDGQALAAMLESSTQLAADPEVRRLIDFCRGGFIIC